MANTIDLYGDVATFRLIIQGKITEYIDESLTELADAAFRDCKLLTSVNLPLITNLKDSAFCDCYALSDINLPNVETINASYVFMYCSSISTFILPKLKSINDPSKAVSSYYTISYCSSLTYINLPKLECMGDRSISSNNSLVRVELPKCAHIDDYNFSDCPSFSELIIGTEVPYVTLYSGTWYPTSNYTIQVPQKLYNDYITDSFWSSLSSHITSINTTPKNPMLFYIDDSSDEVVEFYDDQGNLINNIAIGDVPASYNIISQGSSGKSKYYFYNRDYMCPVSRWGYSRITTAATGSAIGTGKSNTQTVLAITDTSTGYLKSIWQWVTELNTRSANGYNDWYIPSKDELKALYDFLLTKPEEYNLSTNYVAGRTGSGSWTRGWGSQIYCSTEYNAAYAYYMLLDGSFSRTSYEKSVSQACYAIRSI